MSRLELAIVGLGCRFPGADGLESFWSNLRRGVDGIGEVPATHWRPEDYFDGDPSQPDMTYARRGGFLEPVDFAPLEWGMAPRDIEATDTTQLLGMIVAREALEDAGYGPGRRTLDRERTSVILGVTGTLELVIPLGARLGHPVWKRALREAGVDQTTADDVVSRIAASYVPWQENSFPGLLGNVVAGRIANRLDLHGTNCVVDAACASSLSALHLAAMELESGRSDVVITGGLDTFNDIFMYMCFSKTPALSKSGDVRPFDADGDGTILGEGIGMVVLKRLADAERDGDRIYAVLEGIGSSSDGKGDAIYAPSAEGQARALRRAHEQAGIGPRDVGLVEAHGTGTAVGDATEARGLASVFAPQPEDAPTRPYCAIGSVKSMIGHTKAAAGAAGLLKVALALHHRVLPPTIKVRRPIEPLASGKSPFYLLSEAKPWVAEDVPRAGVSAFGFGGSNFHAVLRAHVPKSEASWDGRVQVASFCGPDRSVVIEAIESLIVEVERSAENPRVAFRRLRGLCARLRAKFSVSARARACVVVERRESVEASLAVLRSAVSSLRGATGESFASPLGIYYSEQTPPTVESTAVLFPGQGAQYPGMLRDLACQFPLVRQELERADRAVGGSSPPSDSIHPASAFDDDARLRAVEVLRATERAQPALGAVGLGAWRLLQGFGLRAGHFAGHSYGELLASCAAGWIEPDAMHALSHLRGRLMARGAGERGTMTAVVGDVDRIDELRTRHRLDVVVANRNTPNQVVLSGPTAEVARAESVLSDIGFSVKRLEVGAAFHSPLVAAAEAPFRAALGEVACTPTTAEVWSNTNGRPHLRDAGQFRDALAGQLARPVEFVALVEGMWDRGVRTFVELGPGKRIGGLVTAVLERHVPSSGLERPTIVSLDESTGTREGQVDLARLVARLCSRGHALDLTMWDAGHLLRFEAEEQAARDPRRKLTIPLSGANHFVPPPVPPPRRVPSAAAPPPAARVEAPQVALPRRDDGVLHELVRLQEQTAELHRRFLEGQEQTTRAIERLMFGAAEMPARSSSIVETVPTTTPKVDRPIQAAAQVPPKVAEARPTSRTTDDHVVRILLEVVADKTGYPVEMLELGMGLDADLGIDSIKRVEILGALHERLPAAPAIEPSRLGELHTLGQIAEALGDAGGPGPVATAKAEATGGEKDEVARVLVAIVSEKTGYPAEMLELGMGLDADLGIDSIKRVEILGALHERLPALPPIDPARLGALGTLGEIVDQLARERPSPSASENKPAPPETSGLVAEVLLAVVSDTTGYPIEMLELGMGLDADLGIDSIKRVEILSRLQERLPDLPSVEPSALAELRSLEEIVRAFAGAPVSVPRDEVSRSSTVRASSSRSADILCRFPSTVLIEDAPPSAGATVEGPIWVGDGDPALASALVSELEQLGVTATVVRADATMPERLAGLILTDGASLEALVEAFRVVRRSANALRAAAGFLATVTRLDGAFGLLHLPHDAAVEGAGLAGLAKSAAHEWPEVRVRALDLDRAIDDPKAAAVRIVAELLVARATREIGLGPTGTRTIELVARETDVSPSPLDLGPSDIALVTGGARGVTASVARALARRGVGLVLLGRSAEPSTEPGWLAELRDEKEIRKAVLERSSSRMTPRELAAVCSEIAANREIVDTLSELDGAGARFVAYRRCDARRVDEVTAVVDDVRREHGEITLLVHGAGVLADRLLVDKRDEDVERVLGTKVEGLRACSIALADAPLRGIVGFSSTTARFGRRGQSDYAAANEVLEKMLLREAVRRPGCRVRAIGWGPWRGGMVDAALERIFADEGVGLVEVHQGGEFALEMLDNSVSVTAIALGAGTDFPRIQQASNDAQGEPLLRTRTTEASAGPMPPELPTVFERELDVRAHAFLRDHVIDGRPVLPVAMTLEWLAHGALHGNPGLRFVGVESLAVLKGAIVGAEPLRLRACAGAAERRPDGRWVVPVQLCSGGSNGHRVFHARADVLLAPELPRRPRAVTWLPEHETGLPELAPDRLYGDRLFHGPALQGIEEVLACDESTIRVKIRVKSSPREWMERPHRSRWIFNPLALDCAFQAMIVWSFACRDVGSLPTLVGSLEMFAPIDPLETMFVEARIEEHGRHRARANIDFLDADGVLVAAIRGYECVIDSSLNRAFRRNQLARPADRRA